MECYNRVINGFVKSRNPKDAIVLDLISEKYDKVMVNTIYMVNFLEENKEGGSGDRSVFDFTIQTALIENIVD